MLQWEDSGRTRKMDLSSFSPLLTFKVLNYQSAQWRDTMVSLSNTNFKADYSQDGEEMVSY